MTILQLILLATHGALGFICYNWGKADGLVQGRRIMRKHYEQLANR